MPVDGGILVVVESVVDYVGPSKDKKARVLDGGNREKIYRRKR